MKLFRHRARKVAVTVALAAAMGVALAEEGMAAKFNEPDDIACYKEPTLACIASRVSRHDTTPNTAPYQARMMMIMGDDAGAAKLLGDHFGKGTYLYRLLMARALVDERRVVEALDILGEADIPLDDPMQPSGMRRYYERLNIDIAEIIADQGAGMRQAIRSIQDNVFTRGSDGKTVAASTQSEQS